MSFESQASATVLLIFDMLKIITGAIYNQILEKNYNEGECLCGTESIEWRTKRDIGLHVVHMTPNEPIRYP